MADLKTLLKQNRTILLERWLRWIFDSYPAEAAIFLKKEQDRFDNPVGFRISQGLKSLLDALLAETDTEKIMAGLDEVIRIRAIQDYPPSQALAFIFLLKDTIREVLAKELKDGSLAAEFMDLESRIDGLALLGFDVYTSRREKLHEIRVAEVKNRISGLLRRTGVNPNGL